MMFTGDSTRTRGYFNDPRYQLPNGDTELRSAVADAYQSKATPRILGCEVANHSNSSMCSGNIVDTMEKEQERISMKLMREIQSLREENMLLKQQLARQAGETSATSNNSSHSRKSSMPNVSTARLRRTPGSSLSYQHTPEFLASFDANANRKRRTQSDAEAVYSSEEDEYMSWTND